MLKNKMICPACMGNGYRKIIKDSINPDIKVVIDCKACNNQGEITNNEKSIFSLRYLNGLH
jgi:DnaJ-class molecular chaperone